MMSTMNPSPIWPGAQKVYPHTASECRFLLGGIGTGNISLNARGQLCDFEIFNHPGKGTQLPYTFFALWTRDKAGNTIARVLEAERQPPFERSHGFLPGDMGGLPRMQASTFTAHYPFAQVDFQDDTLPLDVSLEAFTPFVPLDADASSYPAVVLRYSVTNRDTQPRAVTIAGSLANAAGFDGFDLFSNMLVKTEGENEYREQEGLRGVFMRGKNLPTTELTYGTMAMATQAEHTTVKPTWLVGAWWDGAQEFWDDFATDGQLQPAGMQSTTGSAFNDVSRVRIGSMGIYENLQPGESKTFTFLLAWHFPNRPRAWQGHICPGNTHENEMIQTRVSTLFADAWDVAAQLAHALPGLEKTSRDFTRALFDSTLPPYVLEALADNITVIRSPTCLRLADGTFLAWEGCFPQRGCCEGNCTHVWNYAQTLAFLFPELERSMRRIEFLTETDDKGEMAFRTMQIFGDEKWQMIPAADGQMGTILRLYRDWKLCGDDAFLEELWPKAQKALTFAFTYWDRDGDGMLESQQHNTYDIEFYGPNSLTNSLFYAALKAAAEMARYLGDEAFAKRCLTKWEQGAVKMDQTLWGGEYYIQAIEDVNAYRYQYGIGCLADQLFGQLLAHVNGLGYVLPREHIQQAVQSIYHYNFRSSMRNHASVQRTYALNDEAGLLLCSWPKGGRPRFPFVYSDEVWTGIEYQVAAHLIYEGYVEEGLRVVKGVRDRFDGYKRNPFNEIECGNHYARSLASWSVLLALSGYHCDLSKRTLRFAPRISAEAFRCFFSTGKAWGVYSQLLDAATGEITRKVEVLYGELGDVEISQ